MNLRISTVFCFGLAFCLCLVFYVSLPPAYSVSKLSGNPKLTRRFDNAEIEKKFLDDHNLAILIPFRDRFEELLEFVPYMHKFLNSQNTKHHIFVINQVDSLRFNRASLLNAGFLETPIWYDYIALHDVDLLPLNPKLRYEFPSEGPYHVASPYLHPRYHYPAFIGGILLLKRDHFRDVDGMSNNYFGWGLEDDEFYARLKERQLPIFRPGNLTTGTKDSFKHIHNRKVRRRDMIKCYDQQLVTRRRDKLTGLSTTRYKVISQIELTIDGAPLTVLNVELECNYALTPWCNCTENVANSRGEAAKKLKGSYSSDVIVPKLDRKKHLNPDG